jgi:hypothetical protein
MKSPPVQYRDVDAHDNVEAYMANDDRTAADTEAYLA